MSNHWLLIETFGGERPPSIIGVGSTPKRMVPLRSILGRGRSLRAVEETVAEVTASGTAQERVTHDGRRRVFGHPLHSYRGDVHGVWVWTGQADETPRNEAWPALGTSTSAPTPSAAVTTCLTCTG